MKGEIFGFGIGLMVALTLMNVVFIVEEVKEQKGQSYEVCRDKLFKAYPQEVDYKEWRTSING